MEGDLDLSKNEELNKALLEFQVDNVEKTGEVSAAVENLSSSPMSLFVMKVFGIKNEKYAQYVLLFFVIVFTSISLFLLFGGNVNSNTKSSSKYVDPALLPPPPMN